MAFGGTAPFIGTAIVGATGAPILTAPLPTVVELITLVVIVSMEETYRDKLR